MSIHKINPDTTALIIGLGHTGLSIARYLHANQQDFIILDTRSRPELLSRFHQEFPGKLFISASLDHPIVKTSKYIILSPGISLWEPNIAAAQQRGATITSDLILFIEALKQKLPDKKYLPIAAITGTNGKTTVTSMVTAMAQRQGYKAMMAGNIGLPVLACLNTDMQDLYILELSSFQLEAI